FRRPRQRAPQPRHVDPIEDQRRALEAPLQIVVTQANLVRPRRRPPREVQQLHRRAVIPSLDLRFLLDDATPPAQRERVGFCHGLPPDYYCGPPATSTGAA